MPTRSTIVQLVVGDFSMCESHLNNCCSRTAGFVAGASATHCAKPNINPIQQHPLGVLIESASNSHHLPTPPTQAHTHTHTPKGKGTNGGREVLGLPGWCRNFFDRPEKRRSIKLPCDEDDDFAHKQRARNLRVLCVCVWPRTKPTGALESRDNLVPAGAHTHSRGGFRFPGFGEAFRIESNLSIRGSP